MSIRILLILNEICQIFKKHKAIIQLECIHRPVYGLGLYLELLPNLFSIWYDRALWSGPSVRAVRFIGHILQYIQVSAYMRDVLRWFPVLHGITYKISALVRRCVARIIRVLLVWSLSIGFWSRLPSGSPLFGSRGALGSSRSLPLKQRQASLFWGRGRPSFAYVSPASSQWLTCFLQISISLRFACFPGLIYLLSTNLH